LRRPQTGGDAALHGRENHSLDILDEKGQPDTGNNRTGKTRLQGFGINDAPDPRYGQRNTACNGHLHKPEAGKIGKNRRCFRTNNSRTIGPAME
jgi:hypothetical protein